MKSRWQRVGMAAVLASSVAWAQAGTTAQPSSASQQPGAAQPAASLGSVIVDLHQAYNDATNAKAALASGSGQGGTAQTLLSRAESEFSAIASALPSGALLSKIHQAQSSLGTGGSGSAGGAQSSNALSEAQAMASQLDPNIAAKVSDAQSNAQAGSKTQASSRLSEAEQALRQNPLQAALTAVSSARAQLKSGRAQAANQTRSALPSLASIEQSMQQELARGTGGSPSGQTGSPQGATPNSAQPGR